MSKLRQILNLSYCRYYSVQQAKKKLPIISCKRPEFNHYEGQSYSKFEGIKLASKGWLHAKSKNDYFIIYGNANKKADKEVYKKSFEEIGVCNELIEVMSHQGYTMPTEIQTKAIPSILKGNNTVVTAETGCGKTLAYLLPIFQHILEWKPSLEEEFNSPLAVVITPSRELAEQISDVAENIAQYLNLNVTTLVGGRTKRKMLNPPIEYCDMLVTTLGAYSKLVTTGIYKINNVHHVVLDEADTLLDDSFIDKLSFLLRKFGIQIKVEMQVPPKGCQLTLVSATMPHELPESVSSFVAPDSLKTVTTSNLHKVMPHVPQKFIRLGKAQKPLELLKLVQADMNQNRPVMIFSNKTTTCDFVSMFLNENNIECININGQMPVDLKMGKFDMYRSGKVNVLSCTDIASRGLDTIRTQHIINYDFPLYTADYIHRCGRTGRIGSPADCNVTNFVAWPREIQLVQRIEAAVRKHEPLPSVNANIRRMIEDRVSKMVG
ncbi:probable ATP-dependent RNA helicase DDX28 [Pectinophora gossypiella]|uniref:probable ATP-dependent RNA helicase DDX28 n=1 Tax=Pectinophora gossypiella TaxID=13191 RepID=UPI00214E77BC|nr:probable ATP-dependent RNA helicase DDX28 [Pectinophora gossypiella]